MMMRPTNPALETAIRTRAIERGSLVAFGIMLLVVASALIARSISAPLKRLTATMDKLAGGDLETIIPDRDKGAEIGAMAQAVAVFQGNALAVRRLEAEHVAAERRSAEQRRAEMLKLADDFEASIKGVVAQVGRRPAGHRPFHVDHRRPGIGTHLGGGCRRRAGQCQRPDRGQTAKATEEISTQIAGVQSATEEAVSAIAAIGKMIGEMNEIASSIAAAIEEQGAATRDISRNTQEAAHGTQHVSENVDGVRAAAT